MAYVVSAVTENGITGGGTAAIPPSVENDYVFCLYVARTNTAPTVSSAGGGWSSVSTIATTTRYFYKKQGATPDTSITIGAGESNSILTIMIIRGADGTTFLDSANAASAQNSNTYTGPASISPTNGDSLMISAIQSIGVGISNEVYPPPGNELLTCGFTGSNGCLSMCVSTQHEGTGAFPTLTWTHAAQTNHTKQPILFVINDDSSGKVPGYLDVTNAPYDYLHCMGTNGNSGNLSSATAVTDPTGYTNPVTSFNGETLTYGGFTFQASTYLTNHYDGTIESGSSPVIRVAGAELATSQDLSGKIVCFSAAWGANTMGDFDNSIGLAVGFHDGARTRLWHFTGQGVEPRLGARDPQPYLIKPDETGFDHTDYGSGWDATTIDDIVCAMNLTVGFSVLAFAPFVTLNNMVILGGTSTIPATFLTGQKYVAGRGNWTVRKLGEGQFFACQSIQIGNGGTQSVHFVGTGQAIEFPSAYDLDNKKVQFQIPANTLEFQVYAGASDTIDLSGMLFDMGNLHGWNINASTSSSATYDFSLTTVRGASPTLNDIGSAISGLTFAECAEITKNDCDLSGGSCVIDACVDTYAVSVATEAEFNDLRNVAFTNNNYSIRITGNHGGSTWTGTGMTVSGGTGSYDIEYTGTGTLTLQMDVGSGWSTARATETGGGTLTISAPTTDVTVTSNIAGSDIKIFDGTSQTVTASTTGTTLSYTYSGTETWYYTVQKAGYIPQRGSITGTDEDLTVNVTLVEDPVYNASHGLTYTTDYSYNKTTRVLTIVAAQEGRDIYSSMIDEFISNSDLYNIEFPLLAIGPDRIDFTSDGTTAATIDSGDIQYWRGAGMEWEHATTGNKTHKFCSIVGTGTNAAGTKGFFQQVDGASPSSMTLVSNNVNQVIRYYRDDNGDGDTVDASEYDYSGHLIVKLFNDGYYQKSIDVLTQYDISSLESFEYVIPLQMTATGLGTGDRSITITVTDNTPAGVEEQTGYTFDYKVEGGAADSPEDLLRQWLYDVYTDPTASSYASTINFNWPDPIVESGGNYETQRGIVYGESTTTDLHGFYVEEGSDYHPDFLRQESNDGTYFVTPIIASASVSGMQNSGSATRTLLHVYNTTAAASSAWTASTSYSVGDRVLRTSGLGAENTGGLWYLCTTAGTSNDTEPTWGTIPGGTTADTNGTGAGNVVWTCYNALQYQADPASDTYSTTYTDGEEYAAGDSLRIRFTEIVGSTSFHRASATVIVASSGWSVALSPEADSVYADNAIDGSSITMFTLGVGEDRFDVSANTDFTALQAYAWFCYVLTDDNGMHNFWGAVTAIDSGNYRINTSIANVYFDNTTSDFVKQTDTARIFRDTGERPALDPTTSGYGVEINYQLPVYQLETGVSGLTGSESSQLAAAAAGSYTVEGSLTLIEAVKLILASTPAAKRTISGNTISLRDQADSKDRIVQTVDDDGNTVSVSVDGS